MMEGSDSEEEVSGMIRPTLINDLRAILEEYPDNGQIFKELIQNAEDAGATTVRIIYDAIGSEFNPNNPPHFQGPAIYVYNDATFTKKDWEGIKMMRKSVKEEDPMKVGRYGLGFKSVFHITDFPSIISGDTLLLLDPGKPEDRVCTSYRISKGKTTVHCMMQMLARVFDMSRALRGTVFRFPLRQDPTQLSNNVYDHQRVSDLLKCFQTEMMVILVFLKSLETVEIWTPQTENSSPQPAFSIRLTEESARERRERKAYFGQVLKEKSTFSWTDAVNCEMKDHTTGRSLSLRFIVQHLYLGEEEMSDGLRTLTNDSNLSYLPFVDVSLVDIDTSTEETMQKMGLMPNTVKGHVFCFLPLPLQNHSLTGLPVHVNDFFALSSNRHHLKWPTADEEFQGWQTLKDTACLWNRRLLTEAVPKAYWLLLAELIASSKRQGNTQESVTRVYSAFPSAEYVTSMWKCVLNELYKTVLQTPCFFTESNGSKWVTLKEAAFCLSSSEDVPAEVLEILMNLGQTVCPVPQHVFSAVKLFAGESMGQVTPKFVRRAMKKNNAYVQEPHFHRLQLINYILGDLHRSSFSKLFKMQLLPLANGKWTSFCSKDSAQPVFCPTATFNRALFPGLEAQFISDSSTHNFPDGLEWKLEKVCQSETTQLRFVKVADFPNLVGKVARNFSGRLDKNMAEWIMRVWSVLNKEFLYDLQKFQGLNIMLLITSYGVVVEPLQQPSVNVLKQWKTTVLSDELEVVVAQMGVQVVRNIPEEVSRHPCVLGVYVYEPNITSVLKALTTARRTMVPSWTAKQRCAFVSFIAKYEGQFSPLEYELLCSLKLFQASCPSEGITTVPVQEIRTSAPPENIPVSFPRKLIVYESMEGRILGQKLGVTELSPQKLVIEVLEIMTTKPGRYNSTEVRRFIEFLLTNYGHYDKNVWVLVQKVPFLPFCDNDQVLRRPSEVFDTSAPRLKDLFAEEDKFPTKEFAKHIAVLKSLGLRTKPSDEDIVTSAVKLQQLQKIPDVAEECLQKKSHAVISFLAEHPNLPLEIVNRLKAVKFLPIRRSKPMHFPDTFPWFTGNEMFGSPDNVHDEIYQAVVGSVSPIILLPALSDQQRSRLIAKFGLNLPPTLPKLVEQFKVTLDSFDTDSMDFYLSVVKGIYKELQKLDTSSVMSEMRMQKIDSRWIWNGKEFRSPREMYVDKQCQDLNLDPYMTLLPKDMHGLKQFFLSFGCHRHQDREMMLKVLHLIKLKHTDIEISGTGDIPFDFPIILSILRWLANNQEENPIFSSKVLLPVHLNGNDEGFGMMPADQCAYYESSEWISAEDITEDEAAIYLVHKDVPRDLALSLGVSPLMDKLLNATELDLNYGQTEPLTRRLKNLIQHYTDGVAVVKELVQNADDAGADEICFLFDERENNNSRNCLFNKNMAECQGPALWTYNSAEFSDEDFQNITKISGASKLNDSAKIGKFGLGFNAVYNLTDVPSFVSRNSFVVFDPHTSFLGKPGLKMSTAKNKKMISRLQEQFHPFNGVFGCDLASEDSKYFRGTLFRFPLRTQQQADCSKISSLHYSKEEMIKLLQMSLDCAGNIPLFTQHVKRLKFFHLPISSSDPTHPTLLFEVTKSSSLCGQQADIIINIDKNGCENLGLAIDQFNGSEVKWSVSKSVGSQTTCDFLKKNPDMKGLHTLGSVAIPLRSVEGHSSEVMRFQDCPTGFLKHGLIYCYLPLPISTHLPVMINGSFSVTSDRRHLSAITVDEKENRGSKWNELLLQDSVAKAYVNMFVSFSRKGCSQMFDLWPTERNCDIFLRPLLHGFYFVLGSDLPQIFPGKHVWVSLENAVFLDNKFRFESGPTGQAAFEVLHQLLMGTGKVAVDLPVEIYQALFNFEPSHAVVQNTVSLHEFYLKIFLPKIHSVEPSRRDDLVVYALQSRDKIFLDALKETCFVPVDESGTELRKPADLVHPWGRIACLYDYSEKRFPTASGGIFSDVHVLQSLEDLGMLKDILPPDEIFGRAQSVEQLSESVPDTAVRRFQDLINVLEEMNRADTLCFPESVKKAISGINFLPVLQRPHEWPSKLTWKADGGMKFSNPPNVCHQKLTNLVGSQRLILATDGLGYLTFRLLGKLGVRLEADPQDVVCHLHELSAVNTTQLEFHQVSCLQHVYESVYCFLENVCKKSEIIPDWMTKVQRENSLYLHNRHVYPESVAFEFMYDCSPYLFRLSEDYHRKYPKTMELLGVKRRFERSCILNSLNNFYENYSGTPLHLNTIRLLNRLITALVETVKNESGILKQKDRDRIMLPDQEGKLSLPGMLCFDDCPWIDDSGDTMRYVHSSVPKETAQLLGVQTKQSWCLTEFADGIQIPFGQREDLTTRLKGILSGYPCDSTILKELLQNADDSGATEIQFIKDTRTHKSDKIFSNCWKELQGPALCVYNNAAFTKEDLIGIQNLGQGSKREDLLKTGKYGIGFNVVYHLTDVPSFLIKSASEEILCAFDPNRQYLPNMSPTHSGWQWRNLPTLRKQFSDSLSCYPDDVLQQNPQGTLFRFPLRNETMAEKSRISSKPITDSDLNKLVNGFKLEAREALLFTKNVTSIKIIDIDEGGNMNCESEIKVNPDQHSMAAKEDFLSHCRNLIQELHSGSQLESITTSEVKYFVEITDIEGSDRWFVKRRVGFQNPRKIPDHVRDGYNSKNILHLPTGGVAFPLTKNSHTDFKPFCCLPLPISTGLPVHIEADFALDYEQRRNLYYSPQGDLNTGWNLALVQELLAPLYASGIVDLIDVLFGQTESTEVQSFTLKKYHDMFPRRPKGQYWEKFCVAFYKHLESSSYPVTPVVHEIQSSMGRTKHVIKRWLPPTGKGARQAFFNTLERQPECEETSLRLNGYDTVCDRKMTLSKASRITLLLLDLDLNLVATPLDIFQKFRDANVEVKEVNPDETVTFLRSFSNLIPLCDVGKLPCPLQQTNIKEKENLLDLLSYCRKSKSLNQSLEGLPLSLTCDETLRVFKESDSIFVSQYHGIVPNSAAHFLDVSVRTSLGLYEDQVAEVPQVKPFTIADFGELLPHELDHSIYGNNEQVAWQNKNVTKPWLQSVWMFLAEQVVGPHSQVIESQPLRQTSMRYFLKEIESWSLIPAMSTKDGKNSPYLVPISNADQVFMNTPLPIQGSLEKIGLYFMKHLFDNDEKLVFTRSVSLPRDILVSWSSAAEILKGIHRSLSSPLKKVIRSRLTPRMCTGILQYFSGNLKNLKQIPTHKELLKQLPFFVTVYGEGFQIEGLKTLVLPSSIPPNGMEKWSRKESMVLLKENDCLKSLYSYLDLTNLTEIDFYCQYIFPSFEIFDEEARMAHLKFVRDILQYPVFSVLQPALQQLAFIPYQDSLKRASFFYNHKHEVFKLMLDSSKFVPQPFCKEEWFKMLTIAGLTNVVSANIFVALAGKLEAEGAETGSNMKQIIEKSESLVKNLYTEQLLKDYSVLQRVQNVKFLVSLTTTKDLEIFASSHKPATSLICFKDSTLPGHQKLVWSSCDVLRAYCIPLKKGDEILRRLQVRLEPSQETVVQHLQNILNTVNTDNQLQKGEMENRLDELLEIFRCIYEFLQTKELNITLKDRLSDSFCIMIPDHRCFAKPDQVVTELKSEKQIVPYLFTLPKILGPYCKLLQSVGVCEQASIKHYQRVLSRIRKDCGDQELEPNETEATLKAVKGLYKCLMKSDGQAEIVELYLPGRHHQRNVIRASQDVVISDNRSLKERVTGGISVVFLADLASKEIDKMKLWEKLPNSLKPQLLSDQVEEQLTDVCRKECSQSEKCLEIQEAISSTEALQGITRLIKHHSFEGEQISNRSNIENVQKMVSETKIFCCPSITTCLVYRGNIIAGSETYGLPHHRERVRIGDTSEIHIIFKESTLYDERNCLSQICVNLFTGSAKLPAGVDLYLPQLFYEAYLRNPIQAYLDMQKIRDFGTDEEDFRKKPELPTPGSYIPVRFHFLLDPSFAFFEPGQYVGYEIDDPLLSGEDGEAIYVYAVIVEVVYEPASTSWQKRYKINIGQIITVPATDLYAFHRKPHSPVTELFSGIRDSMENLGESNIGETITVPAPDLYAFHRKPQSPVTDVEIYTGITDSTENVRESKSLKEVKKEIFKMLKGAWQMGDPGRKKVIKRLLLKWHPDKNVGREDFCTKITQYLLMLVQRFASGDFSTFDEDDDDNTTPPQSSSSYSGFYGDFFRRTDRRGRDFHRSYQDFSSRDFTDGRHYGGTHGCGHTGYYSSGPYTCPRGTANPQPSEGRRWFRQAEADFRVITNDVDGPNPSPSWVCFKCQQVAEKALKAVLYTRNANDGATRSHDLDTIAYCLDNNTLLQLAQELESILGSKGYLRTRYPDMLHGHQIPAEVYTWDQAVRSKDVCGRILQEVMAALYT